MEEWAIYNLMGPWNISCNKQMCSSVRDWLDHGGHCTDHSWMRSMCCNQPRHWSKLSLEQRVAAGFPVWWDVADCTTAMNTPNTWYILTMVEGTTGWLATFSVNTISGLETHFVATWYPRDNQIKQWDYFSKQPNKLLGKKHMALKGDHIPYHP